MLDMMFQNWLRNHCSTNTVDPDRTRKCDAAQAQFKHGDSRLTLSGDAEATAVLNRAPLNPPVGVSEDEFARIMIETIASSSTEREWLTKAAARMGAGKAAP